ncbi:ABC transporter substrate-binding protein [Haladaptatus sp. DYF46]|uniref:ABC transporter substrate-binding protein n=1 Tax=Haladaptatus sp. DYF46 TaxID=2886041 RepID=UPI001E28FB81|nr:ABC transporter substrate-binding protein [Haladaptatus sp. DYF46]
MASDDTIHDAPTRRDYVKFGGAVVGGGLLAGCSGKRDSGPTDSAITTATPADTDTETSTEKDSSYEACIEPVGCLTFEEPPETWMAITGPWADMALALGQRDGFQPAGWYGPSYFFDRVGIEWPADAGAPYSDGKWDAEVFYELDPDVILTDPNYFAANDRSWDYSDTQEITDNVAPFFGSTLYRRLPFHDYRFYTLYEAFERLATLFRTSERYEAFTAVFEAMREEIQSRLPPESERPKIGLLNFNSSPSDGTFAPMTISTEGSEMKQYRDLRITSAFSAETVASGEIDYEQLLEVNPEIIVIHSGIRLTTDDGEFDGEAFTDQFVTPFNEHPIGSQLTAVQEGNIYPGGSFQQGPIANLFQTELAARQLAPAEFGEFDPENFPDVPEDEQLFSRQRVADIISGDF